MEWTHCSCRLNVPKLAKLSFSKKGEPSLLATKRYLEIVDKIIEQGR